MLTYLTGVVALERFRMSVAGLTVWALMTLVLSFNSNNGLRVNGWSSDNSLGVNGWSSNDSWSVDGWGGKNSWGRYSGWSVNGNSAANRRNSLKFHFF